MAEIPTIKYRSDNEWIDILHPIGSFYFSTDSTSPADLFGGTWTQIEDASLRGSDTVGYTGADSIALTTNNLPSHSHTVGFVSTSRYDNTAYGLAMSGYYQRRVAVSSEVSAGYYTASGNTGGGKIYLLFSTPTIALSGTGWHKYHLFGDGDINATFVL